MFQTMIRDRSICMPAQTAYFVVAEISCFQIKTTYIGRLVFMDLRLPKSRRSGSPERPPSLNARSGAHLWFSHVSRFVLALSEIRLDLFIDKWTRVRVTLHIRLRAILWCAS